MNIIYGLLILIFALGAGSAYLNNVDGHGNGLYDLTMPESGVTLNSSGAESLNQAFGESSKTSELNYIEMLSLAGTTIAGGVLAVLSLGTLMESFHVPAPMVIWFISPLGLVLVFFLFEFWLGRPAE